MCMLRRAYFSMLSKLCIHVYRVEIFSGQRAAPQYLAEEHVMENDWQRLGHWWVVHEKLQEPRVYRFLRWVEIHLIS